ncbi:MAG: PIN domain-containing protein [Actinobacteria bacterium]|nr:PIN domain-containing protein [Actinomycetota bacterium]MCG2788855.1 PIN domain-containing protein [Actinomycetes bacterium]
MVLVDTSAWIFALRKNPFIPLKDRIDHLLEIDVVFTFGMIKLEILSGVKTKGEFDCLKNRLDALYEISTDAKLWETAGQLAFDLKRKGLTFPCTDILIASAAIQSKAILLHADLHFDLIARQTELKVESYVSQVQEDF